MPIGPDEVKGYLRNNWGIEPGFPHLPVFGSNSYEFADKDWFYSNWLDEYWHATKPRVKWWERIYRPNVFDCNTFAGWARMGADLMSLTAQATNREAGGKHTKLIGEFWYYRNSNPADEHAMVIAVFGQGDIGFMEPQTRRRGKWKPDEKCTWYHFR